jgi:hypothetical protein
VNGSLFSFEHSSDDLGVLIIVFVLESFSSLDDAFITLVLLLITDRLANKLEELEEILSVDEVRGHLVFADLVELGSLEGFKDFIIGNFISDLFFITRHHTPYDGSSNEGSSTESNPFPVRVGVEPHGVDARREHARLTLQAGRYRVHTDDCASREPEVQ